MQVAALGLPGIVMIVGAPQSQPPISLCRVHPAPGTALAALHQCTACLQPVPPAATCAQRPCHGRVPLCRLVRTAILLIVCNAALVGTQEFCSWRYSSLVGLQRRLASLPAAHLAIRSHGLCTQLHETGEVSKLPRAAGHRRGPPGPALYRRTRFGRASTAASNDVAQQRLV